MDTHAILPSEAPRNGVAGLKEWRHDLVAGMVVSLISLPFSLGIAVASGAPPICGLISAIIAGLVLPFLGGSYVTVSGPAAGLAPVLLASMMLLGRNNLEVGYPLLLAAICLTGLVQAVLARFQAARLSALFPSAVVEGMLAAIGLLIIAKQLPLILGNKFDAHEFWGIVAEAPAQFGRMEPRVFGLGAFCLVLIFALGSLKTRWLKVVPPQVIAAAVGLVIGQLLGLEGRHLIHIPDRPFAHGIVMPNFRGLFADGTLLWPLFTIVLTLTIIDGVESLATIQAIDKIDPFRRKSDPNRTLFAMGVSNVCSSLAGGLTIIPGGVKSTACIVSGGRTQWANFYNACFLTFYLLVGRSVINMLPYSALGAIIVYTGYKLCAPKVWKHIAHIGGEQLFVFTTTVLVTVSTDLMWGIAAGMATKLLLEVWLSGRAVRGAAGPGESAGRTVARWAGQAGELFRNPVVQSGQVGAAYHVYFGRPLVCFNTLYLSKMLAQIPREASSVCLHVTDLVTLVDHTTTQTLLEFVDEFKRSGRGAVQILGLDRLRPRSHAATSLRVSLPVRADERARALEELSRVSLTTVTPEIPDPVAYLERISLTHVEAGAGLGAHPVTLALRRAGRFAVRRAQDLRAFADTLLTGDEAAEPGHDLDRASLLFTEVEALPPEAERLTHTLAGDHPAARIPKGWPPEL